MNESISMELYVFCEAIRMGLILAVVYDMLRIFRRVITRGTILVALEDIVFWIIAAFAVFNMIYENNSGNLRGYILVGLVIGIVLYELSLSKYFVSNVSQCIRLVLHKVIKGIKIIVSKIRITEVKRRNEQSKGKKRKKIE